MRRLCGAQVAGSHVLVQNQKIAKCGGQRTGSQSITSAIGGGRRARQRMEPLQRARQEPRVGG